MKKIKGVIIAAMFLISLLVVITQVGAERTRESPSNPVGAGLPQGVPTQFMPYFQDFESGSGLWFFTGLWHLVGPGDTYQDYYSPKPIASGTDRMLQEIMTREQQTVAILSHHPYT